MIVALIITMTCIVLPAFMLIAVFIRSNLVKRIAQLENDVLKLTYPEQFKKEAHHD